MSCNLFQPFKISMLLLYYCITAMFLHSLEKKSELDIVYFSPGCLYRFAVRDKQIVHYQYEKLTGPSLCIFWFSAGESLDIN